MPNWCSNSLTVVGDKDYLDKLEAAGNEGKLLETIKPIGEWEYETALNEWGTKWDVAECGVDRIDDNNIHFYFDSAWSPPVMAYEHLLEQEGVENVTATYFEPGMDFCGSWEDGWDNYIEGVGELVHKNESYWPAGFKDLNEEYDFTSWYDVEPDDLVEFIEDGVKARQVAHDV
jgi:hypothetical protein